jgi:hypothetical protein
MSHPAHSQSAEPIPPPATPFTCQQFLARHPQVWQAATAVSAPTPEIMFREWSLAADVIRLACRTLDAAPSQDLPVLMAGLTPLKDKCLAWRAKLQTLAPLALENSATQPTGTPWLANLLTAPYPVQIMLLWVIVLAQHLRFQGYFRESSVNESHPETATQPNSQLQPFLDQLADLANSAIILPEMIQQIETCFLAAFCS